MTDRVPALLPVVVIDDHPLIGTALVPALREHGADVRSCAPHAVAAARLAGEGTLVLLDLDLGFHPDGRRVDAVRVLAELRATGATVLLVTGTTDEQTIAAAVAAAVAEGAAGWVSTSTQFEELLARILDGRPGRPRSGRPSGTGCWSSTSATRGRAATSTAGGAG